MLKSFVDSGCMSPRRIECDSFWIECFVIGSRSGIEPCRRQRLTFGVRGCRLDRTALIRVLTYIVNFVGF